MYKISGFLLFLTFLSGIQPCKAQFYTITNGSDRDVLVKDPDSLPVTDSLDSMSVQSRTEPTDSLSHFSEREGWEISLERDMPVFANVSDSLLADLIEKRLNVCLPLDFIQMNSRFGLRRDPVYHRRRFHDGIDLKCRYQHVYSMLPGVVKEVKYSNRGYGNHIILQHGKLECLYGHLHAIAVKKGDVVEAGTIVAISGNTGKSIGPHLHIRLRRDGKSADPKNLVDYLNDYVNRLQEKIAYLNVYSTNSR